MRLLCVALIASCARPAHPRAPGRLPTDLVTLEGVSWRTSHHGVSITGDGATAQLSRDTGAFSLAHVAVRFPQGRVVTASELRGQIHRQRTPFTFEASGNVRLELDGGVVEAERVEYRVDGVLHSEAPVSVRLESGGAVSEHRGLGFVWDAVSGVVTVRGPVSRFRWRDGDRTVVTADEVSFKDQLAGEAVYRGNARLTNANGTVACETVKVSARGSPPLVCIRK